MPKKCNLVNFYSELVPESDFFRQPAVDRPMIPSLEEILDDIKDEDELQCDFEDLNEKPILNLNEGKVNLINEKTGTLHNLWFTY